MALRKNKKSKTGISHNVSALHRQAGYIYSKMRKAYQGYQASELNGASWTQLLGPRYSGLNPKLATTADVIAQYGDSLGTAGSMERALPGLKTSIQLQHTTVTERKNEKSGMIQKYRRCFYDLLPRDQTDYE